MNLFRLAVVLHLEAPIWSFVSQAPTAHRVTKPTIHHGRTIILANARPSSSRLWSKDDEDENLPRGMKDAFDKLSSLESLGDKDSVAKSAPSSVKKIEVDKDVVPLEEGKGGLSPEKEVQMYTKMMEDLDSIDNDDLYSDVLSEMGSDKPSQPKSPPSNPQPAAPEISPQATKKDMDTFMENALNDALEEVKLKGSDSLNADSILNDKEIMKEIEAIFDRGSEQLMESLEEIRKEQESYAKQSAESSAQEAADVSSENAERLATAEASMAAMLNRVSNEAAQVEKAAQDLRDAQAELDKDIIMRLRNGGLPKQLSFVGLLLFSLRSIADSLSAISSDDKSLLATALVQGGIALVCAVAFFLL
mmetsp:Transcript_9664/g.21761  ORF Transcript_9664/g.21761 Transcript_9664/m.21761 type:complete len:362 (-) Transcript_9664:81-1166(-)